MDCKPGDTVEYQATFTGKVAKVHGDYVYVQGRNGMFGILKSNVIQVLDPKPDETEVVNKVRCPACGQWAGARCRHKQTGQPIKHPHKERIEIYTIKRVRGAIYFVTT